VRATSIAATGYLEKRQMPLANFPEIPFFLPRTSHGGPAFHNVKNDRGHGFAAADRLRLLAFAS